MKKIIKLIGLLLVSLLLFSGCANKKVEPEVIIKKEVKVEYIVPPVIFTERIDIPKPVSKEDYLAMNFKDKEKALGIYIVELLTILNNENDKKEALKAYILSRKKLSDFK